MVGLAGGNVKGMFLREPSRASAGDVGFHLFLSCQRPQCLGAGLSANPLDFSLLLGVRARVRLDDQGAIDIEGGLGSDVLDPLLPVVAQVVDAQAIGGGINNGFQPRGQGNELRRIQLAFEDGVLDSLPVVEAGLGGLPQSPCATCGGGGDIVGDEDVHGWAGGKSGALAWGRYFQKKGG